MIKKTTKRGNGAFANSLGWIGVCLILIASLLLSSEIIVGASYDYQLMMLFGCSLVAFEAWRKQDRQPVILNVVFACIAIYAIIRLAFLH